MTTNLDHRHAAEASLQAFESAMRTEAGSGTLETLLQECAALGVAIRTFHMEAIRFRMFNVDRIVSRGGVAVSDQARAAFADVRTHLEAAGFHTRSHQVPG